MDNTFYVNDKGLLHREDDLPAFEYSNGDKFWYKNGKLHRENDLPAVILVDSGEYWYQDNKLHRTVN